MVSSKSDQVTEKLKRTEEKVKRLMENLPGIAYTCHIVPEWTMMFLSDGCLELTGYAVEELLDNKKLAYNDLIHPDDRAIVWEKVTKAVNADVFFELEYRITTKSGNVKWVWERGRAIYDATIDNNVLEGFISDITERKRSEQRTRDAKNKYETLLNHLQSGVFYIDRNGVIKEANVALIKILGSPSIEQTRKINIFEFQPLIDFGYTGKLKECLETGEIVYGEGEYKSKWGKKIYLEYYFAPIKNGLKVEGVLASVEDVTNKKRDEEELLKVQKLESIGMLAGGIAHDFNNLLTMIFGNISLAKLELPPDHLAQTKLSYAENAIDRATSLTRQLLTFSKGGEPLKEIVDLSVLTNEVVKFDLSGSNIRSEIKKDESLWNVNADIGQLHQVFSNLIMNAKQAMPDGGNLEVTLENIILDKNEVSRLDAGRYVKISFKNEGSGIEEKYLEKIFYPYFTTKQTGSGLGLSVVFSILKKHEGTITARSELGKGSCFSVFLRATQPDEKDVDAGNNEESLMFETPLKVLVMDDESSLLELVQDVLAPHGCEVVTSLEGESAINEYENAIKDGKKFDIVIMDLTIPGGMGGKEAVKRILEIDPGAKCIVSSGYASDSVMANHKQHGFKAAIVKPFKIKKFLETIGKVDRSES